MSSSGSAIVTKKLVCQSDWLIAAMLEWAPYHLVGDAAGGPTAVAWAEVDKV